MKLLIIILILFTQSCSDKNKFQFNITNPQDTKGTQDNSWVKHQDLPLFNLKDHSDGCSGGMSSIYSSLTFLHKKHGKTLQWRQCCEVHDKAYYYGGSKKEKEQADSKLNQCVTKVIGNKFLGQAMQIAVEIGGGPNLPTPYRWGYGEDFRVNN